MCNLEHTIQLNLNLTFTRVWHENFWTNFLCHSRVSCEQIIKIYIYMHVTLESLNKFIGSLMSCLQGLNKFVRLLTNCTWALNKLIGPLVSCIRAYDLMQCVTHEEHITLRVKCTRVPMAPLNQTSTSIPCSVLTLLTIASTTASHLSVSSRLLLRS